MDSDRKAWAVPKLISERTTPRQRKYLLIGLVTLTIVLLGAFVAMAKTVTVDVDGKKVTYITVRRNIGDFLAHTKLNVFPEDLVLPERDTSLQRGMQVSIKRSIPISIDLDNQNYQFRTLSPTVGQALQSADSKFGLHLKQSDEVKPGRDAEIRPDMKVVVHRAIPLTVVADGKTQNIELAPRTVLGILDKLNIKLGEMDKVTPNPTEMVTADTTIKVIRVTQKEMTLQTQVPYNIVAKPSDFPYGLPDRLVRRGSMGLEEQRVKVTYEDGVEVNRVILSQNTVRKPVDKIVARGTSTTISRGGSVLHFKKAILVEATAYSCEKTTDKTTSVGATVRKGVVAVDPRVVPYYTKMYVEGYGFGQALDTGGAIKGNRIDVYFDTEWQALSWGRRKIIVYLL